MGAIFKHNTRRLEWTMENQCCSNSINAESNNTKNCAIGNYTTTLQISSISHLNIKRLQCTIVTDTMHAKVNSVRGNYYCQVFGNKEFFIEEYSIEKKLDCHEAIWKNCEGLCQDYTIESQPCSDTAGTNFTWGNDRRNTRHLRVTRFCMVW